MVLAVSGCSGGTTTAAGGTGASTAATASVAATPTKSAAPALPTGARLDSLLLNASALTPGFKINASGSRNSADSMSPDSPSPIPESQWCDRLAGTSWILVGGISGATWAQRDYLNSSKTEEIGEEVDTFTGTDGQKVIAELWKAFGHCSTFTRDYSGNTAHTTLVRSKLSGVGDQAIKAVETSPTFLGGTTIVAVRVGEAVVTCIYSSSHDDLGSPVVSWAERIGQRVKAAKA